MGSQVLELLLSLEPPVSFLGLGSPFLGLAPFLGLGVQALPAGQSCLLRQSPHLGPTGRQVSWPNPTSNQLISAHLGRWGQLGQ